MKRLRQIIAAAVTAALLLQIVPLQVVAAESDLTEVIPDALESASSAKSEREDADGLQVLYEVEEQREEAEKHFRLSDGSFVAASYPGPVHYRTEDGDWKEIDNTLTLAFVQEAQEERVYTARSGQESKRFAAEFHPDQALFSVGNGEYGLSMALLRSNTAENLTSGTDRLASPRTSRKEIGNPGPELAEGVHAQVENPGTGGTEPIALSTDGGEESTLEEQMQPGKITSRVTYEGIAPGTDLSYENFGYTVKESIVIKSRQERYRYSFLLNLQGLTPILREDGSVELQNGGGEIIYQIPAPYMVDARQEVSREVSYELKHTAKGYILTVEADAGWINSEERTLPVRIDPTVILYGGDYQGSITATCLTEGSSSTGAGGESLYIGKDYAQHEIQAYLQFGKLPVLPANCSVVNAVLGMYQHTYSAVGMNRLYLRAHEVTAEKPAQYETNADWVRRMTWSTKPTFDRSTSEAYARVSSSETGSYVTWDISRVVSKWYADSSASRILAMDAIGPEAFSSSKYATGVFWMNVGYTPVFLIYYRNNVGLESRYTYQNSSVGRAGTASVGDYTGQLTAANTLLENNSSVLPFALTAYYNSPYSGRYFTGNDGAGIHTADYTTMNLGAGWKLSVQETVVKRTVKTDDVSTEYYIYTDGDGTEHYFEADASKSSYEDEEGLGYTLTVSGASATLKDEADNSKEFYNGYLTKLADRNGNAIYYVYNDTTAYGAARSFQPSGTAWKPKSGQSNRMTQVIQINDNGSAADVQKVICRFTYTGNYLTGVVDEADRTYLLRYKTPEYGSQILEQIIYPDGHAAQYAYSPGAQLLIRLYDEEAKAGVEFSYEKSYGIFCVHDAREFVAESVDGTQTVGNAWHNYVSSLQQKQYRFYGQDHNRDTADDVVTHYTFDLAGRTVNVINYNADRTKILGTSAAAYTKNQGTAKTNNRVTGAAASGVTAVNLLHNSGLEKDPDASYGWSKATGTAGANAALRTGVTEVSPAIRPRTGGYLLKMYMPTAGVDAAGSGGSLSEYQTVYLEAGETYVFSGYANSSGIQSFGKGGGLSVSFQNSSGTSLAESDVLGYAVSGKTESGWSRLSVSYTPGTSGNYRVAANMKNAGNYAAFDDFQLEKLAVASGGMPAGKQGAASSVNLLQLGGLEQWSASGPDKALLPTYWSYNVNQAAPLRCTGTDTHMGYVFQVLGHPDAKRRASQTVTVNRSSDATYMLSAWAKATSVTDCAPVTDLSGDNSGYKRFFGMVAKLVYADTATPEYQYVTFDPQYGGWQYASGFVVPRRAGKTVSTITISLAYDYNVNTAWFDQVSLTEEPAQTYTYDSDGKLKTVTSSGQSTDTYTYNGPDLTQFVSAAAGTFTYTYDSAHNMTKASNDGVNLTAQYDPAGNNTSAKLQKGTSGNFLQSSASYTADGDHAKSVTDVNGVTTGYSYDTLGRLSGTVLPCQDGTLTVNKTYMGGLNLRPDHTYVSGMLALSNTYDRGRMSSTARKSFAGNETNWLRYLLPADDWGNVTRVQVQGGKGAGAESDAVWSPAITLASYEYAGNNGPLLRMNHGNGDSEAYAYDLYGRIAAAEHRAGNLLEYTEGYTYDAYGNIARSVVLDGSGAQTADYRFEYDSLGRMIRSEQSGSDVTPLRTQHQYDAQNRLSAQSWQVSGRTLWESYQYNNANGSLQKMELGTGQELSFGYDPLLRLQSMTLGNVYQHRRNYTNGALSGQLTNKINYYNYFTPDGVSLKLGYQYFYNAAGDIREVRSRTGTNPLAIESSFEYDKFGQLTKAVGAGGTETYTYDTAGNLLSRTLGTATTSYTYGNGSWGDLLTAYQGKGIAYEGQAYQAASNTVTGTAVSGNPVSYYNGIRWAMKWKNGRQLASASTGGKAVSYTYDRNGLRSGKTVNGTDYRYAYAGDKLVWQGWNGNELYLFYDDGGAPLCFQYFPENGAQVTGYYLTNPQGDIVRVEDGAGGVLARYTYDAWGKVLTSSGSMAEINPLRYRGYVYDTETGFYYLRSRYYDPKISRFISADSYAVTGQDLLSYNMFAYCSNDPVNLVDSAGGYGIEFGDDPDHVEKDHSAIITSPYVTWYQPAGSNSGVFGGEYSLAYTKTYEDLFRIDMQAFIVSIGAEMEKVIFKTGDSSRLLSMYYTSEISDVSKSHGGVKINLGQNSLDFRLGSDELGVYWQKHKGALTNEAGLNIDLAKQTMGLRSATSYSMNNNTVTIYSDFSANGRFLAMALLLNAYAISEPFLPAPAF